MMALWAVVPVKGLAAAKGRLAPLLTAPERGALAAALLGDVLAALRDAAEIERVLVVSPDPEALVLAETWGATEVYGARIDSTFIEKLGLEVICYGTAVRPKREAPASTRPLT